MKHIFHYTFSFLLTLLLCCRCTPEPTDQLSESDRKPFIIDKGTTFQNNPDIPVDKTDIYSGLVLYLTFSGNTRDASGNGNHGFVHGAQLTTDRFNNPESAYFFDGIDDYIHIPFSSDFDFSDEKEISFGCWADSLSPGFGLTNKFGFFIGTDENKFLRAGISASFYWIFVRHRLPVSSRWYHCFITADDKMMKMYVNGRFIKQVSLYNVKWDEISMTGLYICAENVGYQLPLKNFTKGKIDEIMIYNRVLTAREIHQIYANEK